ncbi:MAG: hypothetical protein ABXS91_10850 [Sulfurimonas sp.]
MQNLPEETNIMTTKSGLIPSNINEAMQLSEILAKSEIVPTDFRGKPSNIFVAVNWGIEIGLSPMQSLQSIAVINGRPSIWGDAALALVRGSGKLEYIHETQTEREATCVVKRKGEPSEATYKFSMEDAQRAGLLSRNGPWKQYPKRMMQMRARSFALRDVFTDVLKGIGLAEEQEDKMETDVLPKQPTTEEPIDPLSRDDNKSEPKQEEDVHEAEVEEIQNYSLDDVKGVYMDASPEQQGKMGSVFEKYPNWRKFTDDDQPAINSMYHELKAV